MTTGPDAARRERLTEFFRALAAAAPASNPDAALKQVADILNEVEDAMTSIPFDPAFPLNDGRMDPPQPDSKKAVDVRMDVSRYRNKGHSTLIGKNGAIQIIDHGTGNVDVEKPGADSRTIAGGDSS